METWIDDSIQIEATAAEVYAHWTRFEQFPRFITVVESVERIDEKRSRWRVNFGFRSRPPGVDRGDHRGDPGSPSGLAHAGRLGERGEGELPRASPGPQPHSVA